MGVYEKVGEFYTKGGKRSKVVDTDRKHGLKWM